MEKNVNDPMFAKAGTASFAKAHSRNSFRRKFIIAFCLSDSENNVGARHNFDERVEKKIVRDVLYSQWHAVRVHARPKN